MPVEAPRTILRRDITVLVGSGINAANHINLSAVVLYTIYVFVINGQESRWSVELGDVSDVDDPEKIHMAAYHSVTNNKHLLKVGGY